MKISFENNLNFGKTLLNQTKVRRAREGMERVDFVEYDPKDRDDKRAIDCMGLYWGTNPVEKEHIRRLSSKFEMAGLDEEALPNTRFYGLEDSWGTPIAVAQITTKTNRGENHAEIDYIQTAPDEKYASLRKKYKGVGETLIAQILQQLTGQTDIVELTSLEEGFWGESGFFIKKPGGSLYPERFIKENDFDRYIQHVENKKSPKIYFWC